MILIAASEFRKNQKKYFQLALSKRIGVKSGDVIFEITPSKEVFVNPSPSGDPFWDNPHNVEELNRRIDKVKADIESGKYKEYPTWEQVKKNFSP